MAPDNEIADIELEQVLREAAVRDFACLGYEVYYGNDSKYKKGDILCQKDERDKLSVDVNPDDLVMAARVFEVGRLKPGAYPKEALEDRTTTFTDDEIGEFTYTQPKMQEFPYLLIPAKANFRRKNLLFLPENMLVPGPNILKGDIINIKVAGYKIPVKVKDIKWYRETGNFKYLFDYDDYGDDSKWVQQEALEVLPADDIVESEHITQAKYAKEAKELFASGALV